MVTERPDPYVTLGVRPTASAAEISQAFRVLVYRHYPDTRRMDSPAQEAMADDRLQEVFAAYRLLRDPHRRADFDRRRVPEGRRPSGGTATAAATRSDVRHDPWIVVGPVRWHR